MARARGGKRPSAAAAVAHPTATARTMTSTSPRWMMRKASPMAWTPLAQAVDGLCCCAQGVLQEGRALPGVLKRGIRRGRRAKRNSGEVSPIGS